MSLTTFSPAEPPLLAGKRVSSRFKAFHFCEWAIRVEQSGQKVTTARIYDYMRQNCLIASDWRAQKLRAEWKEYRALANAITALHQSAGLRQRHTCTSPLPSRPLSEHQRRV
jgi:hypothetical protein